MRSRTKTILVICSTAFALGMLIALFALVDKAQLAQIAMAFRPLQMLLAFGLFLLSIVLRGARFRYMLHGSGSYFTWSRIAALHQFYFTVVPFRLGELSFFPLASRLSCGDFTSSLPVLLNSRLYDFLILALLAIVAVLGLKISGYAAVLLAVVAVLILATSTQFIFVLSQWLLARLHGFLKLEFLARFSLRLQSARDWYGANEKPRIAILSITLIAWLTAAWGFYFVFGSFSIEFDMYRVLFLFAGMTFVGILGFFSVGSIGVSELGLTGLLMMLGFEAPHALALGLLTRLSMLGMTFVATGLMEGLAWLQK